MKTNSKSKQEDLMFSVEVTTYNQKDYIAQTLESIIKQKHNYKYEILVSDDCSSDGTQDVIRAYAKKYPDIVKPVINKKNLGAMNNYYATVKRAKGKYIMECAGDDYWLQGKVASQIAFMERNLDFALCYGVAECFDGITGNRIQNLGQNYADFKDLLTHGNFCPAVTFCFRTDFFKKYLRQIKPEQQDWLMEDYPFLIYTAFESNIYFMNKPLAAYRIIQNSLSHQVSAEKQQRFLRSINDIKTYFSNMYDYHVNVPEQKKGIVKRFFKYITPYGVILLFRKIKRKS